MASSSTELVCAPALLGTAKKRLATKMTHADLMLSSILPFRDAGNDSTREGGGAYSGKFIRRRKDWKRGVGKHGFTHACLSKRFWFPERQRTVEQRATNLRVYTASGSSLPMEPFWLGRRS